MNKKRIGIIICCIAVIVVLGIVLICVLSEKPNNSDNNTESDSTNSTEADSTEIYHYLIADSPDITLPESEQFSWYKKPFIDVVEMKAIRDGWYNFSTYEYIDTQYVAYRYGAKYGLVNSYGEILSDAIYTDPSYCPAYDVITFNDHYEAFDLETQTFIDHGGHGGGYSDFIYDRNSGNYFLIGGSDGPDEPYDYDENGVYIVYEAYVTADGYYCDFFIEENDEYTYYDCNETGKIGLYNNGEIVIPFEYVAATEVSDGVVGMFDGNMWTYFTVDGNIIMENVPANNDTFRYNDTFKRNASFHVYDMSVYQYSCGCVPVKKDGKWGYMDKNGEMIIDAVFDYALPAYENRAWVCIDYYWGIIEIAK